MARARLAAADASRLLAMILAWTSLAQPAQAAGDVEVAGGLYADDNLRSAIASGTVGVSERVFRTDDGWQTAARLGVTQRTTTFEEPGALLQKQIGDDVDVVQENSATASIDQGLGVGTSVGLLGGVTNSALSKVRYYGLRAGQWWRQETLQTNVEVRRTSATQAPIEFTDTDGKRVRTPSDLDGDNVALSVMHLTTPTTILRGGVARTKRSDRPDASAVTGEIRQFVTPADAALHLSLTHFENVGAIEPTQLYGSIVAESAKVEWHQHLPASLILMGGYRYYIEVETPRAADAERKQFGSDDLYGSLRWRYGENVRTDDASELYTFFGRYTTNAPNEGYLFGLGSRWVF